MVAEVERVKTFYPRPIDYPSIPFNEIPPNVALLRNHVNHVAIPRGDLRRGQTEALRETLKFFEEGHRVGYVEQVSGYGKSRYMQEVSEGFGGRQVYIVPGETASTNIYSKNEGKSIGRIDKQHKEFGNDITVITMDSLYSLHNAVSRGDRAKLRDAQTVFGADIIFADEHHHFLTPKALAMLSTFLYVNPRSYMIGASATAGYNLEKHAEKLFGRQLHRVDLAESVEEGVNLSPHVRYVKTGVSLDGLKLSPEGDFIFDSSIPLNEWDKKILEAYLKTCEEEGRQLRTVSYTSNIRHASEYAELANSMHIPVEVITGSTKDREHIYQRLEAGRLATVVTVNTAIESLDKPWLEGTLHSAQTRSMRVAWQVFPRSMRNYEGKKEPWIIQAVAENTSYKRRPILASDILGERKFANGSIVVPRSRSTSDALRPETRTSNTLDIDLQQHIEVSAEIIDIDSLFKMSILDKINLARQGLLAIDKVEDLRKQLLGQLAKSDQRLSLSQWSMRHLYIEDETGERLSFARVAAEMIGVKMDDLKADDMRKFTNFLQLDYLVEQQYEPKLTQERPIKLPKTPTESDRLRKGFWDLCNKFKNGNLDAEQRVELANSISDLIDNESNKFNTSAAFLGSTPIDAPQFKGKLGTITKLLGFDSGIFTSKSKDLLIRFVNTYADNKIDLSVKEDQIRKDKERGRKKIQSFIAGVEQYITDPQRVGEELLYQRMAEKYGLPKNQKAARLLMGRRDKLLNWMEDRYLPELQKQEYEYRRVEIVRNAFESALREDFDIRSFNSMSAYPVYEDNNYIGILSTVAKKFGFVEDGKYFSKETLRNLLDTAGLS